MEKIENFKQYEPTTLKAEMTLLKMFQGIVTELVTNETPFDNNEATLKINLFRG